MSLTYPHIFTYRVQIQIHRPGVGGGGKSDLSYSSLAVCLNAARSSVAIFSQLYSRIGGEHPFAGAFVGCFPDIKHVCLVTGVFFVAGSVQLNKRFTSQPMERKTVGIDYRSSRGYEGYRKVFGFAKVIPIKVCLLPTSKSISDMFQMANCW